MKCPCEECISLAICISRNIIDCTDFYRYTLTMKVKDFVEVWKHINCILPASVLIRDDNGSFPMGSK